VQTLTAHLQGQIQPQAVRPTTGYAPIDIISLIGQSQLHTEWNSFTWRNDAGLSVATAPPTSLWYSFIRTAFDEAAVGKTIDRIEMVYNSYIEAGLYSESQAHASAQNSPAFNITPPQVTDFRSALAKLRATYTSKHASVHPKVNFLFTWQGCTPALAHTIARSGLRSMRTTDAGFFGTGEYTALEAWYAARYSSADPQTGQQAVLLLATLVCLPYVITHDQDYTGQNMAARGPGGADFQAFSDFFSNDPLHAVALAPRYDTHFIPVKHYGHTWQGPTIQKQHINVFPGQQMAEDLKYQACPEAQAEAHEVVSLESHQCCPIAVVFFS